MTQETCTTKLITASELLAIRAKAEAVSWHTRRRGQVYHMCTKCTLGNNIERSNRRVGRRDRRRCVQCGRLLRAGTCT